MSKQTFTVHFKRTKKANFRALEGAASCNFDDCYHNGSLIRGCDVSDFLSQNIELGQHKSAKVTIEFEEK